MPLPIGWLQSEALDIKLLSTKFELKLLVLNSWLLRANS